jgi:tetratricopeptide (TPR) repeat protein
LEQKTFYRILQELNQTTHKSKQYLSDKRLTLTEKKIIEGHLLIRNNQNLKVIELFQSLSASPLPFVEAQRNLLLGVAFNNLSHYEEAGEHLRLSAQILDDFQFHHFRFNAWFNLFLVYLNSGKHREMKSTLQILGTIPDLSPTSEIRLLRCHFLYHSEVNETKKALEYLHLLKSRKPEMVESDVISHLVSEFIFFIKIDDFSHCQSTLEEMKNHRKFQLTENYNFMKVLLNHLIEDTPIYVYEHEFKGTPLLFHQIKLIQSLHSGAIPDAKQHWLALQNISDLHYGEAFVYEGPKSLFSLCLQKNLKNFDTLPVIDGSENSSRKDLLVKILRQLKAPVSKDALFQMVWGRPVEDKEDIKRLGRLISKVRKDEHIDVQTRKDAYYVKAA